MGRMFSKTSTKQFDAAIVERKHSVGFGLGPPLFDHLSKTIGLNRSQVVALGRIDVEVVELPHVVIE